MRLKLRVDGHPIPNLQALMEATSSDRVGEPSQFQARLVKFFLVLILLTLPGALSYLLRAEEPPQTSKSETPTGDRVARKVDARDTGRDTSSTDARSEDACAAVARTMAEGP